MAESRFSFWGACSIAIARFPREEPRCICIRIYMHSGGVGGGRRGGCGELVIRV